MKGLGTILFLLFFFTAHTQTIWLNQPYNYEWKRGIFDSTLRIPVISSNRAFYSNKDSIGLLWFRPDSAKLFGRFPGNIIKEIVTYDTILSIKNGSIHNQKLAAQTADFYISGQGISSTYNTYNAVTNTYAPFHSLGTDALDTTKRLWSIGLRDVTGAPSNGGGNLVFRAYTNAGLFVANVMTVLRSGVLQVSGSISAPTINAFGGTTAGGSSISAGGSFTTTLAHGGATYSNGTSTVTGDYTTATTDTWINVNNSANCTITINNPGSGLAAAGRVYYIKKISNNAFTVTIVCSNGTSLIEGATSLVISSFNTSKLLHDDGTSWFVY